MDGVEVWGSTLAQLMAKRKPQDTWELVPEENLASGHLDSSGFQYRLRGLSRLQCGRCQWGWSSAHVRLLFHLWWDQDARQGLVKMCVWAQRCRACPPGGTARQVSLLNVRLFLNQLVQFIVQKCYGEGPGSNQCPGSDQCPEICFGEHCEACGLGVCFFQKPPDPAWGPEVKSPSTIKGSFTLYGGSNVDAPTASQQLRTLGCGLVADRSRGYTPNSITVPLSVADFVKNPLSEGRDFFGEDEELVTVPFSLVREDKGPVAGPTGLCTVGRGSLYLPASSKATSKGRRFPVNLRAPVFHGKGLLLSGTKEMTGFIYKGHGCVSDPDENEDEDADADDGWGPAFGSSGPIVEVTDGNGPRPMTYIIGLVNNGERSVTFPSSLTNVVLEGEDPFDLIYGSLTFPFIFADKGKGGASSAGVIKGKGKEDGGSGPATAGREPLPGTNAGGPIPISEGSVTIPFSVLSIIQSKGSGNDASGPQSNGLATHGFSKKQRQPGPRVGKSGPGSYWEEDFCWAEGFCFDPYEEVWIWVSMTVCILWIMYLYKFSPDHSPRV
ncbi:LOW QUALITY PROTEIN: receptor-transporting protein 5 [Physeter macrocephalus]|uniref:LOW QUALITY PROTEIN: receptor-transporting protein 5 n=1 Tax=Physeter macrocephalus TaxID=9755 RepID=A0A2Y9FRU7_PHYMC|nr:LOW QUALITY PROTEIN: receptor-transporting protein 5 [Physeter catodon]|eukprot:XP_007127895.2 LOW QUALITY PROTEIN: receptor-transporting protein 5 [Physeter catodon]